MFHQDGRIEIFKDRHEAGFLLGEELKKLNLGEKIVVLGIPRGGVLVSHEVSRVLGCLHGSITIKKIPAPQNPELAVGAVSTKGGPVLNKELIDALMVPPNYLKREVQLKTKEAKRQANFLREDIAKLKVLGKTVIIVDDGVATGLTVQAAYGLINKKKPNRIMLATPIISKRRASELKKIFDGVVSLKTPEEFRSVGQFYQDFSAVTDERVKSLLTDSK